MNRYSINSAALNDGPKVGTIVYLPSSSVTIQRTLSERDSILLSGTLTSSLDVTGDISKVAVIGAANTGITVNVSGTLARFQRVLIGSVNTTMSRALTGALTNRKRLPNAAATMSINVTGRLDPRTFVAGTSVKSINVSGKLNNLVRIGNISVTKSLNPVGNLILRGGLKATNQKSLVPSGSLSVGKRSAIPASTTGLTVIPEGNLRGVFRLHGQSAKSLGVVGSLTRTMRLAGTGEISIDISGDLSNNAASEDLDKQLMIRRPIEREMTR